MREREIDDLELIYQGKVRDIYQIDSEHIAMIASDRVSAFDVVLPDKIVGKGAALTKMAHFWFAHFADLIPNHLANKTLGEILNRPISQELEARTTVALKLTPLPIEAVVRGYIVGSGWKDYQRSGAICGVELPSGLSLASKLPTAIYTPAAKAAVGEHDENINYQQTVNLVGETLACKIRDISLEIYQQASIYALERGVIIADTKFEFGLDADGQLHLMDEVLTSDSSRFWPADAWQEGNNPPSFDKQYLRDYLETLDWDKAPPGPHLPASLISGLQDRYQEAWQRLCQNQSSRH